MKRMSKNNKAHKHIDSAIESIQRAKDFFGEYSASDKWYNVQRAIELSKEMMNNHPFYIGQKVKFVNPPKIEKSSGWYYARDNFVPGKECEVVELDFRGGSYVVGVLFEREYWRSTVSDKLNETNEDKRGIFFLKSDVFIPIKSEDNLNDW